MNQDSVVLYKDRLSDKCNRTESPETDLHVYGQLTFEERTRYELKKQKFLDQIC